MPPSDTFFTLRPHWDWLIVLYFFFGGISAGSYVFAAVLDLFGRPSDRPLARLGYFVAFPTMLICPILLTVDLTRPERFWHMLLQNHSMAPMLKIYSPMSIGAWALLVFGLFVTLSFLGALAEVRSGFRPFSFLGSGTLGKAIAAIGGIPAFFIAGYTGVLLSVTNRPLWADTPMLGALFLLSAASTSAALLAWLGHRRGASVSSVSWIARVDTGVIILEIIAIIITVVTLGGVARVWMGGWGLLLAAVVVFGLLVPLFLHYRPSALGANTVAVAAALAVLGGFLLRVVVIFSSEVV
jgi:formate-dependent nitrite reductase membrane component NrfD